ncbi:universal stress protein [Acidiferrimicrobium sp. IK]|uniref:universal stress protein n=1 Tax=Acidiferrimicrobium sp. IK TaxID=2871700 RepID=UPI0021CAEB4D|nr:universal stress protein [Acidiferrimicrobium sp. IK]MCU4184466.1 universal stress protein [Acidiferrimicrobium sp. IK]
MTERPQGTNRFIVVGVDGSGTSRAALRWAARQAELTGAELHAVMAWSVPVMAYGSPVVVPVDLDLADSTQKALDQIIGEVLGDQPAIKISAVAVEGRPAERLLHEAEGAEALVVGSRGHGAFTGMLLGSVSEHCATHASCPVVVVHRAE